MQGMTYSLSALSLALSELPRALLLLPADAPEEAHVGPLRQARYLLLEASSNRGLPIVFGVAKRLGSQ